MKVSQMIYTACGKERKGDFSTWSKSSDITLDECRNIESVMSYRNKPLDMPYEPTPEDIKKYCPKKYAYFELSSGRKCIAQSNYVSNVYSDLDKRLGNFVIHAFVFNELDKNINPFDIFSCQQFKDALTYREWHDDPIPESLPAIDISINENRFSDADVKNAFASHKRGLVPFIQALMNGLEGERFIVLDAKDDELAILYHIAGLFLTHEERKQMTFSNLYLLSNDYQFKMSGIRHIKIRSLFHGDNRPTDFAMVEAQGNLVFSFLTDKYSDVPVSPFLNGLVEVFEKLPLAEFKNYLNEILTLKDKIHEDGVTTIKVNQFINKKFEMLSLTFPEYYRLLKIALNNNLLERQSSLLEAYAFGFKSNKWAIDNDTVGLLKEIYPYLDEQEKAQCLNKLLTQISTFVDPNLDYLPYLNRFKEVVFSYDDFVKNYVNKEMVPGEFKNNFFSFAAFVYALKNKIGDYNLNQLRAHAFIMRSMRSHALEEVKAYVNYGTNECPETFTADWMYKHVYAYSVNAKNKNGEDISLYNDASNEFTLEYGFSVISLVDQAHQEEYLIAFVQKVYRNPRFLPLYIAKRKDNAIYKTVEEKNDRWFFDNLFKRYIPSSASENAVKEAFLHIDDVLESLQFEYVSLVINTFYTYRDFVFLYNEEKPRRKELFERFENQHHDWVYNNLYVSHLPAQESRDELEKAFALSKSLNDDDRLKYLTLAFERFSTSGAFIAIYIKYSAADARFFAELEKELAQKHPDELKAFNKKKNSSQFAELPNVDERILAKYFEEHYKKGEDAGAYIKQLEKFLNKMMMERKDRALAYILNDLIPSYRGVEDNFADMMDIYAMLEKTFYSAGLDYIVDKVDVARRGEELKKLSEKIKNGGGQSSGNYEVLVVLYKIKYRRLAEEIKNETIYQGLVSSQIETLMQHGLDKLMRYYFEARRDRNSDFVKLLSSFFKIPFAQVQNYANLLGDAFKQNLRDRIYLFVLTDMLAYAFSQSEDMFQKTINTFAIKLLEDLEERNAKQLLNDTIAKLGGKKDPKAASAIKYLEEYESKHKRGFFDRLFKKDKKEE